MRIFCVIHIQVMLYVQPLAGRASHSAAVKCAPHSNLFMISAKTRQLPQLLPVGRYLDGDNDKDFWSGSTSRIPYMLVIIPSQNNT